MAIYGISGYIGRMSDLRPISEGVSRLTSQTFSRKFVTLARILSHWDDVIGPEMARKTQPAKIHYRKPKDAKSSPQATLDIAVSSADATLLHYQIDIILERLNQIFGERWITGIRFVHQPANMDNSDHVPLPKRALAKQDLERLDTVLITIEDDNIRKQLEKLGQAVLRKSLTK